MTRDELIRDIRRTAKYCRIDGQYIVINHSLPYVEVNRGRDDIYIFQGEEASDLLDEVPDWINEEDYILWLAQGW